jgi:hypothetical protein
MRPYLSSGGKARVISYTSRARQMLSCQTSNRLKSRTIMFVPRRNVRSKTHGLARSFLA